MIGKKEFGEFVSFINNNKTPLDENTIISLKRLITIWKNNNDTDNGSIYLNNFLDYDVVTDFVKSKNIADLLKIWESHVTILTSQKLGSKHKNDVKLNVAHYEFKLKISEIYEKNCSQEKEMLDFYRKVTVLAILSGNSEYMSRPLIDKLLINCRMAPFDKINCLSIEVRPSNLHGHGVFATNKINAGTIISFYPVDGYNEDNSLNYKVADNWVHVDGANMENHSCTLNENLKIVADPNRTENKMLLGHMFNDSVGNTFKGEVKNALTALTTHEIENGIYEYYIRSNNNCKLKINELYGIIYIITTSDIEKDEELTFSYSPLYWFNRVDSNLQHFYDVCNSGKMIEFVQRQLL